MTPDRERIEREARCVFLALGARTTPMLDALTKAPAATHYALGGDFDKAIASVTALVLRERAAALDLAARVASNTVCATHLDTGVVIYGNKAADAITALAAQERAS